MNITQKHGLKKSLAIDLLTSHEGLSPWLDQWGTSTLRSPIKIPKIKKFQKIANKSNPLKKPQWNSPKRSSWSSSVLRQQLQSPRVLHLREQILILVLVVVVEVATVSFVRLAGDLDAKYYELAVAGVPHLLQ